MPSLFGRRSTYRHARSRRRSSGRVKSRLLRILRVLGVLVGIALLVLPPLLIAHPISYVPLIMAVLVVAVSWLYLRIIARSVRVTVAESSLECERGSEAGFAIDLENSSFLPVPRIELGFFMTNLFGEVADQRKLVCSLAPRQRTQAYFDVTFAHLGKYEAGIDEVKTYDLLGLFSRTHKDGARNEVLVRPAQVNLTGVQANEVTSDESMHMLKPIASDNEDYASVREYQRGDPMKTVHWNLSSRNPDNKLYTRLYEEYVNPSLVIVIDCFAPDYDDDTLMSLFDGIVESAAALCVQSQAMGVDAEVRYINSIDEKAAAHLANDDDVINFVGQLHRIVPEKTAGGDTAEVADMLRGAGLQTNGFGNVAFVTSRADEECVQILSATRMRRRNTMAFVAMPRDLDGRDRDRFWAPYVGLESLDVRCYAVESTPIGTEVSGL